MQLGKPLLIAAIILATALPCVAFTHSHRGPTSPRLFSKHLKSRAGGRLIGQRTIDDARATQIQASLIKSGYLSGETSGHWDTTTEAAMQKYQSDNGWQTKLIPDSRAIIKLGLGPTPDSTLRSSTAMTASDTSSTSGFMQR
jgi:Putative peptidoglycan binding domain